MARIQLKKDILEKTRERSNLTPEEMSRVEALLEEARTKGSLHANLADFPAAFLRALLDDARLTANQRAAVAMQVYGMSGSHAQREQVYETQVGSPIEFGSTFVALGGKTPNSEMFLNGRWYPVTLSIQFVQDRDHVKNVILQGTLTFSHCQFGIGHFIHPELFLDELGQPRDRTVAEILGHFGYRRMQTAAGDFNLKLVRAERMARETGQMVLVQAPVLVSNPHNWWSRFESRALGTPGCPRKAVIEPELEVGEDERHYYAPYGQCQEGQSRLPFVRLFSLETKGYVFADVDDLTPYEFDGNAMARLHLPDDMLRTLTSVFSTRVEHLFGDLISGKHGGVVVLACGNPGVGKTLTAEVYAEHSRRPLYVLELGELGTNAAQVETSLQRIFARVSRWNAVLQFDECEIFLAQRGNDLERSAIVGIFLRLLDYYQGILFLTTNRPDVLDHAVLSRVMLKLRYPDLDWKSRAVLWRTMLQSAGLTLLEGTFDELAEPVLNGRQIRNLTRLAKILHPAGEVTLTDMRAVMQHGSA
ncbi:MAG: ATP-binding protein [Gemmataceae bacterium]|nr:ATP-binding protein [Gemmataceae bacterium]